MPYDSRADAVMYRQELAELAHQRDWPVHFYNAKNVTREAVRIVGAENDDFLQAPRLTLGAPWTKDHRMAFAATITAG